MSERYTRLFSLPENLHAPGAPILITAGALLLDHQTGQVLAQLKLQNIGPREIRALTVRLDPRDAADRPLGEAAEHQYLDLHAGRDALFGQQTPLPLPNAATRAFSAAVTEVVFADRTVWTADGAAWTPLPAPVPLERALGDAELARQFCIQYGAACRFAYQAAGDLWRCACGAVNQQEEETCHHCGMSAAALRSPDLAALKQGRDVRLSQARQKAEAERAAAEKRAAEEQAAAQTRAKRRKKRLKIGLPLAAAVLLAAAAILIPPRWAAWRREFAYLLTEQTTVNYDGAETTRTYTYDKQGNLTEIDFGDGQKNTYTYDDRGNLLSIYFQGTGGSYSEVTYEYDSAGNRISYRDENDEGEVDTATYTYDAAGHCIREESEDASQEESAVTDYVYENGLLIEERTRTEEWGWDGDTEMELTEYRYDSAGNCIEEIYYRDSRYYGDELDETWKENEWRATIRYEYDEDGNCTLEQRTDGDGEQSQTISRYDEDGNLTETTYTNTEGEQTHTTYRYDGDGNCVEETATGPDGVRTVLRQFDEHGNCVEEVTTNEEGETRTVTSVYEHRHAPAVAAEEREEEN